MSPVELLREAAKAMRKRARAASAGAWTAHPDGLVWAPRAGDPVSGSTEVEDAEHIASWHPAVALAVADWLDYAASTYLPPLAPGAVWGDQEKAVAVARAYLGGES